MLDYLTSSEIAAFLGVSPAAVRQVIHRHGIHARARQGRHKLYSANEVLTYTGFHDRIPARPIRPLSH